jgi:Tetratricopeptide repeat
LRCSVKEEYGDEAGAVLSYHQLGMLAQHQRDLASARAWYLKALLVEERQGSEHGAAITYHQLGVLASLEGRVRDACAWLLRAIGGLANTSDAHAIQQAAGNYRIAYRNAPEVDRPDLRRMWVEAGLDPAFLDEAS